MSLAVRRLRSRYCRALSSGPSSEDYLGKILNARVYDLAIETPLQHARMLSAKLGSTVMIKREDLQPVFSFKIRGAYNKIATLSREQMQKGIVACSAGNHAQGVAMSAAHLDIDAVIVMPQKTPRIKVDAVRGHGGRVAVVLHGKNYDEAAAEAMRLVESEGRTLIHPFDDPEVVARLLFTHSLTTPRLQATHSFLHTSTLSLHSTESTRTQVIAGQGTIAMEVLRQMMGKPLDAIFVCCGGGGMLAGIAAYVKRVRPEVRVIGVEADGAAGMTVSLVCRVGSSLSLDYLADQHSTAASSAQSAAHQAWVRAPCRNRSAASARRSAPCAPLPTARRCAPSAPRRSVSAKSSSTRWST